MALNTPISATKKELATWIAFLSLEDKGSKKYKEQNQEISDLKVILKNYKMKLEVLPDKKRKTPMVVQ